MSTADYEVKFDCCGKTIQKGDHIHNVGSSMEVILYCDEHV